MIRLVRRHNNVWGNEWLCVSGPPSHDQQHKMSAGCLCGFNETERHGSVLCAVSNYVDYGTNICIQHLH